MKYAGKESSTLEFKEKIPSKQQIIKSVLGFCNLYGGKIVIGVNDNQEIVGVPEEKIEDLIDTLHRSIHESSTPPVLPAVYTQRIDEKILLVIEVSSGMNKPYFRTSEGMAKGTYIRIGTQTVKTTSEMIEELKWKSRGRFLDELPVYAAAANDIDDDVFQTFLNDRPAKFQKTKIKEVMSHYNILIKEHLQTYPTVGGVLLFGKNPQRFLPEAFVICTHFQGTGGRDVIATRDLTGTLFDQYNESLSFIISRLNKQFKIKGAGKRKEVLEIPDEAIREVLLNAIVHRNYHIPGPAKVAIYDNRVEIFSPGNFPGPLNIDELEMGITYIRNAVITKIFREAGYIEKLGSGFRSLFESYRKRGLPKPIVIEGTGFIKCILPRPVPHAKKITKTSNLEKELSRLFYIADEIKIVDVMSHLNLSRATAGRLLASLVQKKLIKRVGKGPSTYYIKH